MPRRKQEWAKRNSKERFKKRYLSRMQATRLLQVDSMNFRRMCILKGVYPRSLGASKQKASGNDKQYYLTKEIKWMVQDPILSKIMAFKAWEKKMRRAKAMHLHDEKATLESAKRKPKYRLDVALKERYPYFTDALKDLDDALTLIALYAFLAPEVRSDSTIEFHHALPTALHEKSVQLIQEWLGFVAKSHVLTRAFISVKGYYYEALVHGERIMWVMPHEYASQFPSGIQQYMLITFLEFYVELTRFAMFKLNKELSEKIAAERRQEDEGDDENAESFEAGAMLHLGAGAVAAETAASSGKRAKLTKAATVAKEHSDLLASDQTIVSKLFNGLVFYCSREVPLKHVKFIVDCCGGRVVPEFGPTVTHYVVDRPALLPPHTPIASVEYIQPQYLFDCLNARMMLPVQGYRMGEILPPHVSPFTVSITNTPSDNAAVAEVRKFHPKIVSYVPERVHEIRALKDPSYSRIDPDRILQDDQGSEASEDARLADVAPELDSGDDVSLDGNEARQARKMPRWEDETVQEHAVRSKASAFKVQKQRELGLLNKPTTDARAAQRAERANAIVAKKVGESRDARLKRKMKSALAEERATTKMRLQVAKPKARKYFHMVSSVTEGVKKHEQVLASKAKMLKEGRASADGKTYQSARSTKRTALQAKAKRRPAKEGNSPMASAGKQHKKHKGPGKPSGPYSKLPKWVR